MYLNIVATASRLVVFAVNQPTLDGRNEADSCQRKPSKLRLVNLWRSFRTEPWRAGVTDGVEVQEMNQNVA